MAIIPIQPPSSLTQTAVPSQRVSHCYICTCPVYFHTCSQSFFKNIDQNVLIRCLNIQSLPTARSHHSPWPHARPCSLHSSHSHSGLLAGPSQATLSWASGLSAAGYLSNCYHSPPSSPCGCLLLRRQFQHSSQLFRKTFPTSNISPIKTCHNVQVIPFKALITIWSLQTDLFT